MSGQGVERRLRLRNGAHGYGLVTKLLHWLTVAALAAQFTVGLTMDFYGADDGREQQLEQAEEQLEEDAEGRGEAAEESAEAEIERREDALDAQQDGDGGAVLSDVLTGNAFGDGLSLPELHVCLGLLVIALASVRVVWRRTTPLPPWAPHLSAGERRWESSVEKALLLFLSVVPATGLLLLAAGDEWLPLHVTAQLALLAAVAGHVGLVLKHTVVRRDRHLARML